MCGNCIAKDLNKSTDKEKITFTEEQMTAISEIVELAVEKRLKIQAKAIFDDLEKAVKMDSLPIKWHLKELKTKRCDD